MGFLKQSFSAMSMLIICIIICGIIYPAFITLVAQLFFPWQANGSMIVVKDKIVGSHWIGQNFTSEKYFWGRPSATIQYPYNAEFSSGSNLGPSNPLLTERIQTRIERIQKTPLKTNTLIPTDFVTSSASGLDPHISLRAALLQIERIAKARNIKEEQLYTLIQAHLEKRFLGLFGQEVINVLRLNLALDALQEGKTN